MFSKERKNTFDALIEEALKTRTEFEKLQRSRKLSSKAFLAKSLELANATSDDLDNIERQIKDVGFQMSRIFLEKAVKYILTPDCSRPSPKISILQHLGGHGLWREYDQVASEMAVIHYTPFALFALATREAIKKDPDAFGNIEDMDQHQTKLKECEAKIQELCHRIEKSWTGEDVDIIPAGSDTGGELFRIFFKGTSVSVGGKNSAEALINHLISTR